MSEKTILVDYYVTTAKTEFDVDSLPIHCLPGIHDYVYEQIIKTVPIGSAILELGAGSGAFSKRLKLMGYDVTASDYVYDNFRLHDVIPFVQQDLNEYFSKSFNTDYDCIIAIELIEHIENPRHFLRECKNLLKPNGYLFFTTPNVDNPVSKALYLRDGYFQWFSDFNYNNDGHITPLTQWYIYKIIKENRFCVMNKSAFGNPFDDLKGSPRMKFLASIIRMLSKREDGMDGEISIYSLRAE